VKSCACCGEIMAAADACSYPDKATVFSPSTGMPATLASYLLLRMGRGMARQTQIVLTDALDGTAADSTILFSYEGATFEIDLSKKNAEKFAGAIEPYIEAGRRLRAAPAGRIDQRRGRARRARQTSAPGQGTRAWK
jgi:hypothetical protein